MWLGAERAVTRGASHLTLASTSTNTSGHLLRQPGSAGLEAEPVTLGWTGLPEHMKQPETLNSIRKINSRGLRQKKKESQREGAGVDKVTPKNRKDEDISRVSIFIKQQ